MLETLAEKAAETVIWNRLALAAERSPKVPLNFAVAVLIMALAVTPLYGCHVERSTNARWRAEIAANSAEVRAVVGAGSAEAIATDTEIIKALGVSDEKRLAAEAALRKASTSVDGCPALPARCYGVRQQ